MRLTTLLVVLFCFAFAPRTDAAQDLASPGADVRALPWLSHVTGSCWRSELSEGSTWDRQCFRVQFGKVVRVEQVIETAKDGEVATTLNADSVYAWDPHRKRVRHVFWASDGSFETSVGWSEGDALMFFLDREVDATGVAPVRTVLRKAGANAYCASREKRQGGRWVQQFAFLYVRDGDANEPAPAASAGVRGARGEAMERCNGR
jgi:hypothetical protein